MFLLGKKLLKLSTGEIIKTPNVIRTIIPERIVQQYQQYCCETNFEPMSKRTLQRVWTVCSSSVRKSLQGLDNFSASASGMEAVDALEKLVDKLVDCGKTQHWAREIKQQFRFFEAVPKGRLQGGCIFYNYALPSQSDAVNFLLWFTATSFFPSKSSLWRRLGGNITVQTVLHKQNSFTIHSNTLSHMRTTLRIG